MHPPHYHARRFRAYLNFGRGCGAAGPHRSGGRSMSVRMVTRRLLSRAAAAPATLLSSSRGFFRATWPARPPSHGALLKARLPARGPRLAGGA